jgi:prepilin-type N-terminal cleavage/methylation domain-containing protein
MIQAFEGGSCHHAPQDNRPKAGFTLIEVVIAVFLLGIFIASACALAVSSKITREKARSHYVAVSIAKNRLERVKTFDFDEIDYFEEANIRVDETGTPDWYGPYQRTTSVTAVTPALKEAVVRVQICDRVRRRFGAESEEVRTYIAKTKERPE